MTGAIRSLKMIGEKLGSYTIVEIVGSGNMGIVYRAEDPEGQTVALKLVRSQVLDRLNKGLSHGYEGRTIF